jgi:hypothetical protein
MVDRRFNRKVFGMDDQRFDGITQLAAHGPGRRNMLKLAGVAAVAGTAGFLAHAEDAEAKMLGVTITNVLNGLSIKYLVKNKTARGTRMEAAQICAVVEQMNQLSAGGSTFQFTCTYPGQ